MALWWTQSNSILFILRSRIFFTFQYMEYLLSNVFLYHCVSSIGHEYEYLLECQLKQKDMVYLGELVKSLLREYTVLPKIIEFAMMKALIECSH